MSSSPTVLAGGQLALLSRHGPVAAAAAPEGLLEALGQVPDPRDRRGRRYRLAPVLAVAVCAVLAGARSYAAIAEWAADAPPRLRARLGLGSTVPDLVTIWRVLTAVDPAPLDRALGAWVSAQLAARRPGGRVVLAVDGKTVRGARTSDGTAPHLLACLDHGTGVVLAQAAVDSKTNEISVFTTLLGQAGGLRGVLVTADALHAQREHATWLHEHGAHYLVTVKGNQPSLLRQLRSLPWKDVPAGHVQDSRGHGRTRETDRQGGHGGRRAGVPARRPGHPDHPPHPPPRQPQVANRDKLRDHQPARGPGPPRPARHTDPRPLEDRKPASLGP
jgi:predicted transposase YbfD/YdcC